MGRPIKKKFFGNLNREYYGNVVLGTGVGGEGVASVSISNTGTAYSQGTTVSFTAPQIAGGKTATGHATFTAFGTAKYGITDIVIDNAGSGYITAPTVSVTTATGVAYASTGTSGVAAIYPSSTLGIYIGMQVLGANINAGATYVTSIAGNVVNLSATNAGTVNASIQFKDSGSGFADSVTLTSTQTSAIAFSSYLTTGSSAVTNGDIVKQEASRRYLVNNSQGEGQCSLVSTSTLTAGTMNIVATDWNGSTYYVKKLTARKAVLVQTTVSTAFLVGNGVSTGWTLGAATGTVVSIAHTI
jgi:hypothetical protein